MIRKSQDGEAVREADRVPDSGTSGESLLNYRAHAQARLGRDELSEVAYAHQNSPIALSASCWRLPQPDSVVAP